MSCDGCIREMCEGCPLCDEFEDEDEKDEAVEYRLHTWRYPCGLISHEYEQPDWDSDGAAYWGKDV